MVAVKSLLTILALGAQALAATSSVVCATDLGTKSIKSVPTSTTTVVNKITVIKKVIRKVNVIVVPVAKTTTIRSTSTVTVTSVADTDVDTATETETTETFTTLALTQTATTTRATTTTITSFTDTIVLAEGFTPIAIPTVYKYMRRRKAKEVHLLSGTSNPNPLYPQRVRCVKRVPSYSTKVVSTTIQGPRSTLKPATKTKVVNTVTTTTTTVFPTDAPTTITITEEAITTSFEETRTTMAVTQTFTIENLMLRNTVYDACQSSNILRTANSGGRVVGVSGDNTSTPPTVLGHNYNPESCCIECQKLPNCRASLLGKVSGLSASTKNTCSLFLQMDASKCNGAQPVFANYVTSQNCPTDPQFIWSNGPCGQLMNGGDIGAIRV